MAVNAKENLLLALLGCGTLDLDMLDDVKYDFYDIIDQLDGQPIQEAGFNGLMRAVVDVGIIHIKEALEDRLRELRWNRDNDNLSDRETEELNALEQIDPDDDIRSYHNCLDTNVWFERNGAVYRTYLSEAVDSFEENTGLCIGGDGE